MIHLLSPTGHGIRGDPAGDGHFGSPRGSKHHQGTDFICTPGQQVYAPAKSIVIRNAYPYPKDTRYSGILLDAGWCLIKLFYLSPCLRKGVELWRGQLIGIAQDISLKYPGQGMTPHIHMELSKISTNPEHYTIGGIE